MVFTSFAHHFDNDKSNTNFCAAHMLRKAYREHLTAALKVNHVNSCIAALLCVTELMAIVLEKESLLAKTNRELEELQDFKVCELRMSTFKLVMRVHNADVIAYQTHRPYIP
jgi:hypothetical protein